MSEVETKTRYIYGCDAIGQYFRNPSTFKEAKSAGHWAFRMASQGALPGVFRMGKNWVLDVEAAEKAIAQKCGIDAETCSK